MKHFNQISRIVLIVVAIVGLTIGMSPVGDGDEAKATTTEKVDEAKAFVKESKCGEGKCGGDEAKAATTEKVDEAKASVKEGKCGEGKCG